MNTELLREDELKIYDWIESYYDDPASETNSYMLLKRLIEEREKNADLNRELNSLSDEIARLHDEVAKAGETNARLMPFVDRYNEVLNQNANWRELWEAIREALTEDDRPYKGWYRLRAFLESHGQYAEDLGDNAVLCAAIDAAMKPKAEVN